MSKDTAISIAASEVWTAGRKYQDKYNRSQNDFAEWSKEPLKMRATDGEQHNYFFM